MKRQKVLSLKPTQFAVGMLEVEEKINLVKGLGKKQRRAFINDNPIPVVISPEGDLYVVDHHHFLAVCYHVGIKKVRVSVVKDLSKSNMSYTGFWKWMWKTRHSYPFCQFGEGPRKALYLPRDIRGVADDPYRSLAWFVRKTGAFEGSDRNFAEFKWANFFRSHKLLDRKGPRSLPLALKKAVLLAQTPAARRLPGFDKLNLREKKENEASGAKKEFGSQGQMTIKPPYFEELDYQQTPLGELTLSRRTLSMLGNKQIFEIKLNDEFLMSSLFFASEVALAKLGLAALKGDHLDVIVGGLGLGFTAVAALEDPRVQSLLIVEYLEAVIGWHQRELLPLSSTLNQDPRCRYRQGDFFALAQNESVGFDPLSPSRLFHAILLDIDHSPQHFLNESHRDFYSEAGLRKLSTRIHEGGVFALWSNDAPEETFLAKLQSVFVNGNAHVVTFDNPLQEGESRCTVYVAVKSELFS